MKKFCTAFTFFILVTLLSAYCLAVPVSCDTNTAGQGEFIVKLSKESASLQSSDSVEEIYRDEGLYLVSSKEDLAKLIESGIVEYAEPNAEVTLMSAPNDPHYNVQWNLRETGVESAWDAGLTGAGVRVAVIDSGINRQHEDFAGVSIENGYCLLPDQPETIDNNGHGTVVSGIIAAARNNNLGIAGITDKVTIIPIKCFDTTTKTGANYIIEGIYRAVDDFNCDIINLSLGMEIDLAAVREAVDYAVNKGVIIVSAVGNKGSEQLLYPAAYPNVVGVGAFDAQKNVCSFSERNGSVFITAPGSNISSLSFSNNSAYVTGKEGTSYAVPYITALAAMAKQHAKEATVSDFMKLLMETAIDLGEPGYDQSYGHGIVDVTAYAERLYGGPLPLFSDMESHWARDYVEYCANQGIFSGVGDRLFDPERNLTRSMFVTTIYRIEGAPMSEVVSSFEDVPLDSWYADAAGWAVASGVALGVSETRFDPDSEITREQAAAMLLRYTEYKNQDVSGRADLSIYSDAAEISDWALDAMSWANAEGLITGMSSSTIFPGGTTTRAQAATILARYTQAE